MADAAKLDGEARRVGKPAMQKLKMLPEVVALLNRNTLRDQLVDPDLNLLEAVRFFLEPLDDGSLPAYNIQRELFAALAKLPINKDALVASGIGKVTLFYLKSAKPEAAIRRQAERLIGEWSRPILNRSDDYRKRQFVEVAYDPTSVYPSSTSTAKIPNLLTAPCQFVQILSKTLSTLPPQLVPASLPRLFYQTVHARRLAALVIASSREAHCPSVENQADRDVELDRQSL